jgi:recombinational DNA repair protein RecR
MMKSYPGAIEELMLFLKQLPGIGKRGAERMVMAMLDWDKTDVSALADAVQSLLNDQQKRTRFTEELQKETAEGNDWMAIKSHFD